jgi:Tfp pilus assembly protein PilO
MKNKTKNTIIFLSLIFVALTVFVIYFKLSLNNDIEYIIETKKNNVILENNIKTFTGLKNKIKESLSISEAFDQFYIDRNNILNFIDLIEKISTKNKVTFTIDSVNVDETHLKEDVPYGILEMNLTIAGNYDSLINLLSDLEKLPYLIDINNVKISVSDNEKNSFWTMKVSFNGITN